MQALETSPFESLEKQCLEAVLTAVVFDGWNDKAFDNAAKVTPEGAILTVFPGGMPDVADAWHRQLDSAMLSAYTEGSVPEKVRQRVHALIMHRLNAALPHRDAVRALLAWYLLPQHWLAAQHYLFAVGDTIWRAAGDTSTDFNYYTKRFLCGEVYRATVLYWLNDNSVDQVNTAAFCARRIDDVLKVGGTVGKLAKPLDDVGAFISRALGKLRPLAIILAVLLTTPSHANDTHNAIIATRSAAKKVEAEAASTEKVVAQLSNERIRLAASIQDIQETIVAQNILLQTHRAQTRAAEVALDKALHNSSTTLQQLLQLARRPVAAALLPDEDPRKTLHGAALLRWQANTLQKDIAHLNEKLDALAQAEATQQATLDKLDTDAALLKEEQLSLNKQLEEKKNLYAAQQEEAGRLKKELDILAKKEETLRGFLSALDKRHPATQARPLPLAEDETARPTGRHPVAGTISRRFGENYQGYNSQGITYAALEAALVTAPVSGRVAYAGAYAKYGEVVILAVGKGDYLVLAGLKDVLVHSGETLAAGEPVGRLTDGGEDCCHLYVELRRRGIPINPLPYLLRSAS
ncbi:MAG: COQ9 family protein [Holosporales bacterium]|jgi:ubiquinone biosynthesis protein COQ9